MTQTQGIILIVDDNEHVIKAIREPLTFCGFHVLSAATAPQAMALVKELRPALVILDLKMPGTNGIEFLKDFRREEKQIPVILLTGYYDEFKNQITPEMNVFGYLAKRFYRQDLEKMVFDAVKRPGSERTFSERAKARLLIVDDQVEITSCLRDLFRERGFVVSTANRPAEALKLNGLFHADIVIADIRMPGLMDGIDMVYELRKSEQPPRGVIFISGVGNDQISRDKMKALLGKEEPVVPKPFGHEVIEKLVAQMEALVEEAKTAEDG